MHTCSVRAHFKSTSTTSQDQTHPVVDAAPKAVQVQKEWGNGRDMFMGAEESGGQNMEVQRLRCSTASLLLTQLHF